MKLKEKKTKVNGLLTLSELSINSKALIVEINCTNLVSRKRLFEMGVTKGTFVEIKKKAPLGDPVIIKIRGYELCLRNSELKKIVVKVVK